MEVTIFERKSMALKTATYVFASFTLELLIVVEK